MRYGFGRMTSLNGPGWQDWIVTIGQRTESGGDRMSRNGCANALTGYGLDDDDVLDTVKLFQMNLK